MDDDLQYALEQLDPGSRPPAWDGDPDNADHVDAWYDWRDAFHIVQERVARLTNERDALLASLKRALAAIEHANERMEIEETDLTQSIRNVIESVG